MNIFICRDHNTFWPVGAASIVVAATEAEARKLLDEQLIKAGLKPYARSPYTFTMLSSSRSQARILCDGNY